ncbi:related to transporter (major facilitator superfamily) [Phialocephala subalpina]|uniref:Related to transporter (Major facilitator superfamily) n=1 Tax=Phialocephala subalpina TaxID=576137 RepID=A0A1L7XPV8_9HELO|nr:related to transporter (major facilitator superfamily) [Phialocephala subalpina]
MGLSDLPFTKHFTKNLAICTFLIGISVFNYGFDQTGFSTIQAMDPFIDRFGTRDPKTKKMEITPTNLSLLNSLPRITFGLGILMGGVLGERFGRRPIYVLMLVICIMGTIISYTAKTFTQVVVGRMLNQMYTGMEGWLVPMFQAEIIPAQIRGVVVVSYVFNHVFGSFVMACVTYKTSQWMTDASWQIPIAVMFIIPSFALALSFLIPESPRWLVRKGKEEKALTMMRYIYGSNPSYAPERELALLKESLELEMEKGSWKDLVRGTNLRRTAIIFIISCGNQLTGQAFSTQYGTVFVKSIGTLNPYTFTLVANALGCLGPFMSWFLIEPVGRRNMYLYAGGMSCACLFVMGGLGVPVSTFGNKAGIIAMTILYPLFYTMSFGGITPVIVAEVPSLKLRDKSAVIGWSMQNVCAFLVTFTVPYLINVKYAGLGSKVGFIYGSFALLFLIWAWFYLPEVRRRSLEEIDEMFIEKVPTRKFKTWTSSNMNSAGAKITDLEAHAANAGKLSDLPEEKAEIVHEENIQ